MGNPFSSWRRLQRFSIRKLTIGVVSATIGTALVGQALPSQPVLAQSQEAAVAQQVQIDYHYVNYEDLTAQQKAGLKSSSDFAKEFAQTKASYILVYRQNQPVTSLPETGEVPEALLSLLGLTGVLAAIISLARRDKKTLVKVVLITSLGTAGLSSSAISALDGALKTFLTTSHQLTRGDALPAPQTFADKAFYGYLVELADDSAKPMAEQDKAAGVQPEGDKGQTKEQGATQPVNPADKEEPSLPTQPVDQDEPSVPTKSVDQDEPSIPTKPVDKDEPSVPTQPVDKEEPSVPTQPVDQDEPALPTKPADKDEPSVPTKPVDNDDPSVPTKPTDKDEPSVPTKPADNDDPSVPTQPVDKDEPSVPTKPVDQDEPALPTKPADQDDPSVPTKPVETTSAESIAFTTEVISDDTLPLGEEILVQAGVAGVLTHTYLDGQLVSSQVTIPPVNQIIRRGTKVVVPAQPVETTSTESIAFTTEVISDDTLPLGEEVLVQAGVSGVLTHTYLDGQLVSSQVTTPAVNQIIRRGTKVVVPAQPVETTSTEVIPFTTEVISDDTLPLGEEILVQAGVSGVLTHTYLDGQLVSSQVTIPPVNQIIRRGTKVVVPAQPVETTSTESIAFTTEVISDDTLPLGEEVLVQAGVSGVLTHTYLDGQLVSSQVTTPAVNQIIRRGTKVVVPAQPVETTSTESIAFTTEVISDDTLPLGEEVLVQAGVSGVLTHTYLDGQLVSSQVTTPAVNQIIRRGTKVIVPAQPVETTSTESVAFTTEVISDDTLPIGEEVLVQAGVAGVLTHTYLDGQLVSSQVTTPAVNQIIRRGTKVVVPAQPVETTSTESIAFTIEVISDDTLPLGEEVLVQAGVAGVLTHTYLDGQLVSSQVTTPAVNHIIRRGTKVATPVLGTETDRREIPLPYRVREEEDDQLWEDERREIQEGRNGLKEIVTTYQIIDGQRQPDPIISEREVQAPQERIVRVGTKPIIGQIVDTEVLVLEPVTERLEEATLWSGDVVIQELGRPGEKTVSTTYETVRGVRTEKVLDRTEVVTRSAINRIEIVGTKPLEGQVVETSEEVLAFDTHYRTNPDLPLGETRVVTQGRSGLVVETRTYRTVRGEKVGQPEISREERVAVQHEVIERGSKVVAPDQPVYGTETDRREVPLPYRVREEKDETLWEGERQEVQEGRNGLQEIVTTYETIDGQRQPNPRVVEREVRAPQERIVRVGTKPIVGRESVVSYETIVNRTETRQNANAWVGDERIIEQGSAGQNKVTTVYKTVRGVRTSEVLDRQVEQVRPAVNRIVEIGTKPIDGRESVISYETILNRTETRQNANSWAGDERIIEQGSAGQNKVTTVYKTVRGVRTTEVLDRQVEQVRPAVNRIVEVGTKPVMGRDTVREVVAVAPQVSRNQDASLWDGDIVVDNPGQAGEKAVIKVYETERGQRTGKILEEREEPIRSAIARIERIGTKPIVGRESVVSYETIVNRTETRQNANAWAGDERIIEQGSAGQNKVTTVYKTVRGVRTTEVLDRQVEQVRPAVNRIVEIGTKPVMGRDTVREVVAVAPKVSRNQDASLWDGDIVVDNPGQAGEKAVIKVYETNRGQRTGKILEEREESIRFAIDRIERVGTKPIDGRESVVSYETILNRTETRQNANAWAGDETVIEPGSSGQNKVTTVYKTVRGVRATEVLDRQVEQVRPAVNRIVEVGTKPIMGRDTVREVVTIAPQVSRNQDASLWDGDIVVDNPGQAGEKAVIKVYETERGQRTGKILEEREEPIRSAIARIERIGTKPIVGQAMETSEEVVKFTTSYRPNPNLPEGQTKTVTEGRDGVTVVTKTYRTERGQKVGQPVITRTIKTPVQNALIEQGSKPVEVADLTIDLITSDDHINVTEAKKPAVTISGQARGAQSVLVRLGDKEWTASVTTDRYSLEVSGADLVTNASYQVTVSNGNKTANRPYTVAAEATNHLTITEVETLAPASDTVRLSGSLRLEGLAAKHHNDLFVDTVLVSLKDKTYTVGLGKTQVSREKIRGWWEDVKTKEFHVDIPVADLKAAEGETLRFALPKDHHVLYDARGSYGDSVQEISTAYQSLDDQTKYTLKASPWLQNGTGKIIILPAEDKATIRGRVAGNAQEGNEVEIRIGEQVYRGQVNSDKEFSVTVDRSVLQDGGAKVIKATLLGKDYANRDIRVSDSLLYHGNQATSKTDFVTTFDRAKSSEEEVPYFIKAIRDELYNSTGHLLRQQIGQENYTLTYHFINDGVAISFNPEQKAMMKKIFDEIASHTKITFVEKETIGPGNTADINLFILRVGGRSHAYMGGSVYFTALPVSEASYKQTYETALHEVLHSLGAEHPHEGTPPLTNEDGLLTSVMTYNLKQAKPSKPLRVLDQMYLHYRYGVNPNQHKDDNTYTFKRQTSYSLEDSNYIWDGSGLDTFDASMETKPVTVDLTPGSWIYRGNQTTNFWADETKEFYKKSGDFFRNPYGRYDDTIVPNAMVYNEDQAFIGYGTQIERLIGSAHADTLRGNVADNDILGGAGADKIWGDAGDDYIDGGAGADQMDGGSGNDTYIVDNEQDVVTEGTDPGRDHIIASVDYDLPVNVEDLTLTGTAELGYGNNLANRITGNSQANTLRGRGGADTFVFNSPLNGQIDTIEDFDADDTIELSAAVFAGIVQANVLDYIIYDSATGQLAYDPDGRSGLKDSILFATLPRNLTLRADQIVIR